MSSNPLKSSENIQQKEGGLDCTVSKNKFCPMTLKALAMNPERQNTAVLSSKMAVNLKTDKNPNWIRIAKTCLEYIHLNLDNFRFLREKPYCNFKFQAEFRHQQATTTLRVRGGGGVGVGVHPTSKRPDNHLYLFIPSAMA